MFTVLSMRYLSVALLVGSLYCESVCSQLLFIFFTPSEFVTFLKYIGVSAYRCFTWTRQTNDMDSCCTSRSVYLSKCIIYTSYDIILPFLSDIHGLLSDNGVPLLPMLQFVHCTLSCH